LATFSSSSSGHGKGWAPSVQATGSPWRQITKLRFWISRKSFSNLGERAKSPRNWNNLVCFSLVPGRTVSSSNAAVATAAAISSTAEIRSSKYSVRSRNCEAVVLARCRVNSGSSPLCTSRAVLVASIPPMATNNNVSPRPYLRFVHDRRPVRANASRTAKITVNPNKPHALSIEKELPPGSACSRIAPCPKRQRDPVTGNTREACQATLDTYFMELISDKNHLSSLSLITKMNSSSLS